jgi:hypothetical protein
MSFIVTVWAFDMLPAKACIVSLQWPENRIVCISSAVGDVASTDNAAQRHIEEVCQLGLPMRLVADCSLSKIDARRVLQVMLTHIQPSSLLQGTFMFELTRRRKDAIFSLLESHTPVNASEELIANIGSARRVGSLAGSEMVEAVGIAVYAASMPEELKVVE